MVSSLLPRSRLEALAPGRLPKHREERYDGSGFSAPITAFSPEDAQRLRELYDAVRRVCEATKALLRQPSTTSEQMAALQQRSEWDAIPDLAQRLGTERLSPELRTILHDIRGGSLIALLSTIDLVSPGEITPDQLTRLYCYARDHLKIMRNGVPDVDVAASLGDRALRPHHIGLLGEKWAGGRFAIGGATKHVLFECTFEGAISSRCLEFAALDRVVYNLMNNAARHGAGDTVGLSVFAPATSEEVNVRFVVQNAVSADQAERIRALTHDDPARLLLGGITTGGTGLGLRICTDFVKHAFGLSSADEAVEGGYVGTRLIGDVFVTWFHWPCV